LCYVVSPSCLPAPVIEPYRVLIPIACARACFQLVQSSYLLNASLTVHGFDFSPLDDYRIRDSTIVGAQVGSYLHTHIHTPSVSHGHCAALTLISHGPFSPPRPGTNALPRAGGACACVGRRVPLQLVRAAARTGLGLPRGRPRQRLLPVRLRRGNDSRPPPSPLFLLVDPCARDVHYVLSVPCRGSEPRPSFIPPPIRCFSVCRRCRSRPRGA
jgi:hypothetical protein